MLFHFHQVCYLNVHRHVFTCYVYTLLENSLLYSRIHTICNYKPTAVLPTSIISVE